MEFACFCTHPQSAILDSFKNQRKGFCMDVWRSAFLGEEYNHVIQMQTTSAYSGRITLDQRPVDLRNFDQPLYVVIAVRDSPSGVPLQTRRPLAQL